MNSWDVFSDLEIEDIEFNGLTLASFVNRSRNVVSLLEDTVAKYPDKTGFICGDRRLTYREFDTIVNRLAAGLQQLGIKKNDHVALLLGIQIDFPICFFAVMKIGAIAVPLNTRFKSQELAYEIKDSESKVLIVEEEYWPEVAQVKNQLNKLDNIIYIGAVPPKGTLSMTAVMENPVDRFEQAAISESDDATILYTSGTTGKPKGAVLHHHGLVITAMLTSYNLQPEPEDKLICCVPLFHATGLAMSMLSHIFSGITGLYMKHYKTKDFLEIMAAEKVAHFIGVGNILWLMIHHPQFDNYDFTFFRKAMLGGSPVTEEMLKKLDQKLPNLKVSVGYGLTESHALVTTTPYDDTLRKIKTVGKALPVMKIKIVDDSGKTLPTDGIGEIMLRGVKIFKRYWKNDDATSTTLINGWLNTGDIGKMDSEGYVYLLDRKKDMINRGGEKIYSQEVENVISSYPKVLEVAVIGIPDQVMGEVVKAFVVLMPDVRATETELREFCEQQLADFKVPKYIEFIEVLPRNAAGKMLKSKLRD